jgi:hypothetical protein
MSSSSSAAAAAATPTNLKRPKSLGSGEAKRVVSAPVVMGHTSSNGGGGGGSNGMMLPPHARSHTRTQTAYYGSSSRGGKRSTSVPQQMQYGGSAAAGGHYQFTGYPPPPPHAQRPHHYSSHQQQYPQPQQSFPATAAQWVAGGTGTAPAGAPLPAGTSIVTATTAMAATAGTASGLAVSDDVARRLLLSEWIAGGKAAGHQLELQRKMEAEADAYRTAGLMGIDPDEIAMRLEGGKEDIVSIVESHRAKAMGATAKAASSTSGMLHAKKRKLSNTSVADDGVREEKSETRKRIDEALNSMGAL